MLHSGKNGLGRKAVHSPELKKLSLGMNSLLKPTHSKALELKELFNHQLSCAICIWQRIHERDSNKKKYETVIAYDAAVQYRMCTLNFYAFLSVPVQSSMGEFITDVFWDEC